MDGYGNDTTATADPGGGGGDGTAQAIAQIFQTGVTAYVDSQAIQRGYQINDPRYFNAGYPGGVGTIYRPATQGVGVMASGSISPLTLLLLIGGAYLLLRKG